MTLLTHFSISFFFDTSTVIAKDLELSLVISEFVEIAFSLFKSAITNVAPLFANDRAIPLPIPSAPPVTTAIFPINDLVIISSPMYKIRSCFCSYD